VMETAAEPLMAEISAISGGGEKAWSLMRSIGRGVSKLNEWWQSDQLAKIDSRLRATSTRGE
jgi:hypothetical protein